MDVCIPPGTDWSCRFSENDLMTMQSNPEESAKLERAEAFGWSLLAALTAYRIGTCPIVVRPCALQCLPRGSYNAAPVIGSPTAIGKVGPFISGGLWYNSCGCRQDCSCTSLSEIILPGPVGSIVEIYIDGEILPRTAYRVDNGNRLVRLDGGEWPACQDMAASDQEGFSVRYYRGAAPNTLTRAAAGVLAAEFYDACSGNECRLPGNVTAAVRQGESYTMTMSSFFEGDTNIPEVDAVVRIYNPYRLKSAPTIASPDETPTRVPTWI
jgi:hypothetical protein